MQEHQRTKKQDPIGRREFLHFVGAAAAATTTGACSVIAPRAEPALDPNNFHARRRFAHTASGRIAYVEQGGGLSALFLHGAMLNGFQWRYVMAGLQDMRRCIALDMMGHGYSEVGATQEVSMAAQARMVAQFLDALGLQKVDLIGNDSGGGVAQIFAADHPQRIRTLTLTNCDVHDNWPTESSRPIIEAARKGLLANAYRKLLDDAQARRKRFASVYVDPNTLTDEVFRVYAEPLAATPRTRDAFHRFWTSLDNAQTVAIESKLRALRAPTLIVWARDDVFFDIKWAYWLQRTIPGVRRVVEVAGARLFFPEDRPAALTAPLREFWAEERGS